MLKQKDMDEKFTTANKELKNLQAIQQGSEIAVFNAVGYLGMMREIHGILRREMKTQGVSDHTKTLYLPQELRKLAIELDIAGTLHFAQGNYMELHSSLFALYDLLKDYGEAPGKDDNK